MRFLASLRRDSPETPLPQILIFPIQFSFKHVDNMLPSYRHELESMSGACRGNVEVLGIGVRAYAEIHVFGISIPGEY